MHVKICQRRHVGLHGLNLCSAICHLCFASRFSGLLYPRSDLTLSILIVSEVLSYSIYQFHIVCQHELSSRNPNWRDNLCPTKICGQLSDWLRLTKEASRVQLCLWGRSAGSFPKQLLVIEPIIYSEILIFQTSRGKKNWFKKSVSLRNQVGNFIDKGKQLWFKLSGGSNN